MREHAELRACKTGLNLAQVKMPKPGRELKQDLPVESIGGHLPTALVTAMLGDAILDYVVFGADRV